MTEAPPCPSDALALLQPAQAAEAAQLDPVGWHYLEVLAERTRNQTGPAQALLQAKLLSQAQQEQADAQASERKLQVGSGDRSQRIRTYNFPQGRITDHRVEGLTLYALPQILDGDLDELVDRLSREHQADELKLLTEAA